MTGISSDVSLRAQGRWLMVFGGFLIVCGLLGYASNPAEAKTALISGGSFGLLFMVLGWLLRREIGFIRWVGLTLAGMLAGVFTWRASVSWEAVANGESKQVAAVLITAMLVGALATIVRLLRG